MISWTMQWKMRMWLSTTPPSPTTFRTPSNISPMKKKTLTPPLLLLFFSSSPPPSPTPFPPQPLSLLQDFAVQTRNRCLPGPCWKTPLFWMPATCFSFRDEGSQLAFLWSQFPKKKEVEKNKLSKCLQVPSSAFKSRTYTVWAHLFVSTTTLVPHQRQASFSFFFFVICGRTRGGSEKWWDAADEKISWKKSSSTLQELHNCIQHTQQRN